MNRRQEEEEDNVPKMNEKNASSLLLLRRNASAVSSSGGGGGGGLLPAAVAAAAPTRPPSLPSLTLPPEQYRFIPGSPPTFVNKSTVTPPLLRPPTFNGTGYYIEDGEPEPGLNDIQTLFLACFATLIPLVIILVTAFTIRYLWRRYKRRRECMDYDGVIHRESNSEPIDRPLHSHLLNGDKLSETHLNTEDTTTCDGSINNGINRGGSNHSTTNGSIITMTLKNNHLIVETEERNDLEEDSRETTMKYSPSARDGVFVVEVQQGVRRTPYPQQQKQPPPPLTQQKAQQRTNNATSTNDQCALIHHPPETYDDETLQEEDERYYIQTTSRSDSPIAEINAARCKTGLAQSNQSLAGGGGRSYAYGNQHEYDNGYYGYPCYHGYVVNDEPMARLPDRHKPKITAAIYKTRDSIDFDGPLLSDLDDAAALNEQIRLGNE